MIIKYKPLILSIELLSHIILISINKNIYINYKEIIREKNTEDIIKLIDEILIKNYIIIKNINFIVLNYGIQNYTNSKIISAIIQSISLSIKIPTIKLSLSTALALNISSLTKKKYIIIINKENENYINEEIYIKNINMHLLSNDIIYKKNNKSYIIKNSKEIKKNLNLYKQKKIIPHIYTYFFIKKKNYLINSNFQIK